MLSLKPKKIDIKSGNKWIAVLSDETANKLDLHTGDRIQLLIKRGKFHSTLNALLDISDNTIGENSIGLFVETWNKLGVKKSDVIHIHPISKPVSTLFIREKLTGKRLSKEKIEAIIKDVVNEDLTDVEISYFVAGCFIHGLSDEETLNLTRSIVKNGQRLHFGKGRIVLDKHCIGGVPGNRTTMIIIPICASLGLIMPKTSSRAITSPSGTADTMETLCNVTIPAQKLIKIAQKTGGFIAWGGGVDLAAADDKMIKARYPLSLDPEGMLLASIMAKKFAAGSTHVLIDIPVGEQVKIKSRKEGAHLKKRFEQIARKLGMKIQVIFTDGEEPIGRGIGPALEAIDVMETLKGKTNGSNDLREKSLEMGGLILELCGKAKKGKGYALAQKQLDSGAAYRQMIKIIEAQGKKTLNPKVGSLRKNWTAQKSGKISKINNKLISTIARVAGAPKSPGAGIWMEKKLNDRVKKGDTLFTIYSENKGDLKRALTFCEQEPYKIG